MAIVSTTYDQSSSKVVKQSTHFVGRVVRLQEVTETRNHSDTMDYSDFRSTKCTYALVYLGRHGIAPNNMSRVRRTIAYYGQPRDLEPIERFAWIDCTGLFVWRGSPHYTPEVDTIDMQLVFGGEEMLQDLKTWEEAVIAEREESIRLAEKASQDARREQEKKAAKQANKLAKEQAKQTEAQNLLSRIPSKGTQVTINGFTGEIFWTGVSKYRGSYNARAGVKDSTGNVIWVDATQF